MKILAILFVIAIAGVIGFASSKPDSFHVERARRMHAPPEKIFPLINDFSNWDAWSPWVAKDPAIEITMSDKTSGMGAMYEWAGNNDVGRGRMEVVTVLPLRAVRLKRSIFEPMVARNAVEFSLQAFGEYTKVTWSMRGSMDFLTKLTSTFMSMDDLVGPDLELGLNRLQMLAEK